MESGVINRVLATVSCGVVGDGSLDSSLDQLSSGRGVLRRDFGATVLGFDGGVAGQEAGVDLLGIADSVIKCWCIAFIVLMIVVS